MSAKHVLTDVTVEENSLVDRPANQRTFLVKKRSAADGDGYLNPILKEDLEQERAQSAAKPEAEKDMKKNDTTAAAAAEFASLVEAAVKSTPTAPTTVVVVATPPAVVKTETPVAAAPAAEKTEPTATAAPAAPAVEKTEPTATAATPAPAVEKTETAKVTPEAAPTAAETTKADAPTTETQAAPAKKSEDGDDKITIQPALKGALEAGLRSIGELADKALKTLAGAQADLAGISWTPWDIRCHIQQIDDLADRMLDDYEGGFGGSAWVADAILAGGAADGVSKAGAAMAAARRKKFVAAHGDMGSAFKGLKKAHDAMGALLKEVAGKEEEKTEKAEEAPAPVQTAPAAVAKSEKDISEVADLQKQVAELRKELAAQTAVLAKARLPQQSNVIPVEKSDRGNDTMNRDVVWPDDMGANNRQSRPGRF